MVDRVSTQLKQTVGATDPNDMGAAGLALDLAIVAAWAAIVAAPPAGLVLQYTVSPHVYLIDGNGIYSAAATIIYGTLV